MDSVEKSDYEKLIEEKFGKHDPACIFFRFLEEKRPDFEKASQKELFVYILKYYSAKYFFKLGNKYHEFISYITGYWPFSLFFQDRIYHASNKSIRDFVKKLEKLAGKLKTEILLVCDEQNNQLTSFKGYFFRKPKNRTKTILDLESIFQKEFDSIFLRDRGNEFEIFIPTDFFKKIVPGFTPQR